MFSNTKVNQMADSLHGSIVISYIEKKLISTQAFNRLHNVLQNSTAYLTFPSNRTKRFEHSLGVMHLGSRIFYHSIINTSNELRNQFFDEINDQINKILKIDFFRTTIRQSLTDEFIDITESYQTIIIDDPLYKTLLPNIVKEEHIFSYVLTLQSIRLAALLHDIGHPPFSHITENALKKIWENVVSLNNDSDLENSMKNKLDIFKESTKFYDESDVQLHEQIGLEISKKLLEAVIDKNATNKKEAEEKLFYWLLLVIVEKIYNEDNLFKDIHRIIDSSIDCDRMDYISRDMINSGFSFGRIEYDRLITSMVMAKNEDSYIFCPSINSLSTVEDILNRRWMLYKNLVFHHRVMKTDRLLENIIVKLAEDYFEENIDDNCVNKETQVLPPDISGLWLAIKEAISNKKYFNALIQWDDAWLLTILRKKFFEKYHNEESNIRYQMEELLSNKKYYRSMIKKMDSFLELDKSITENFDLDFIEFKNIVGERWSPLLNNIQNRMDSYKHKDKDRLVPSKGFFIVELKKLLSTIGKEGEFYDIIEKTIKRISTDQFNAMDCIVVFNKKLKTGLEKHPPFLYQKGKLIPLNQVSRLDYDLKANHNVFPLFYIYVRENGSIENHNNYLSTLGKEISKELISLLKSNM